MKKTTKEIKLFPASLFHFNHVQTWSLWWQKMILKTSWWEQRNFPIHVLIPFKTLFSKTFIQQGHTELIKDDSKGVYNSRKYFL